MIISINTDELDSSVQLIRSANEAINAAASLLNSVAVHDDWQCPEKYEINNNTVSSRSEALSIQTDSESFYKNISCAVERFKALEQKISESFDSVDAPIAEFLSKTPSTGLGTSFAGVGSTCSNTSIVDFKAVSDSFQGNKGENYE